MVAQPVKKKVDQYNVMESYKEMSIVTTTVWVSIKLVLKNNLEGSLKEEFCPPHKMVVLSESAPRGSFGELQTCTEKRSRSRAAGVCIRRRVSVTLPEPSLWRLQEGPMEVDRVGSRNTPAVCLGLGNFLQSHCRAQKKEHLKKKKKKF